MDTNVKFDINENYQPIYIWTQVNEWGEKRGHTLFRKFCEES